MSQKMETNQNAPSVIARLMGLDKLPPQRPLHRQQKVLSEDYLRKTASIGVVEKSSLCVGRLSKKNAEKQDKRLCGSVMSKIDKHILRAISYEKANPITVRAEFGFSRQRNSCAKCHSMDKKLYSASMSTSASDYSDTEVCRKPDKMMTHRTVLRSLQKFEESQQVSHIDHLDKLLKSSLELKNGSSYSSRRIVVLKPNPGKAQNCARDLILPTSDVLSQTGDQRCTLHDEVKPEKGEINIRMLETAGTAADMEPPKHSLRAITGVAKKTSLEGKQNTGRSRRGLSRSRIPADKSSADASEALTVSAQRRDQVSYPFPSRSIFSREAKKQIFDRWKTTKNFKEVEVVCGRCTLGEMFAMHDRGAGPRMLDSNIEKHGSGSQCCPQGEKSELGSPSHIGRKCRPKAELIKHLPKSKHFENSSIASGSPKFMTICDASQNGTRWVKQEAIAEKRYKLKSKNSTKEDILEPRDPRLNCEEHHSADLEVNHNIDQSTVVPKLSSCNVPCSGSDDSPPLQVTQVIQDELKFNCDKKDIHNESEQSASNMSTEGLATRNLLSNAEPVVDSFEDQLSEISPCIFLVKDGCTSSDVWDNLTPQRSLRGSLRGEISSSINDSDLAMKLDEINQPSPDSVLESPFKEENTVSSECSNSPPADLSGLAMKLQLLESISKETNSETSGIAVSSDEDTEKGSLDLSQDNEKRWGESRPEESRDFSYLIDVIDEVCLCGRSLNLCYETWQCPLSPLLFETLEKKYGKQTSWLKSERRLLFDFINSALREILNSFMVFQISGKPLRRRFNTSLRRDEIEEELWMLLLSQEKEVSKDLSEKALGREMKWFELEEDITLICKEMEEILFDELAAELGSNECT